MFLLNFKTPHRSTLNSVYKYSTKPSLKPDTKTKWKSVIGLEIHAQIATESKLFAGSRSQFGRPVNTCVALFDASIPGTLPVLNKKCVEAGVKTALALSCRINPISMFDRKHYFYADLPAGYQITQQRSPLARNGLITFPVFVPGVTKKPFQKSARLHQLQLEQDSGKSLHDEYEGRSLVDLNRAGTPLMELVFEPDLSDGEEAASMVKELILILTRLGTCTCKMEEGALRVDANISIHQEGEPLGTRTEVKNIGSIRGVAQAISYEIERQIQLVEDGGTVHNETRSWDAESRTTITMRDKEVQQDYRFMPEPNLPPLHLDLSGNRKSRGELIDVINIKDNLPEMPERTRQRLVDEFGLPLETSIILVNESKLLQFFTEIIKNEPRIIPKTVANILINDLLMLCHKNHILIEDCKFTSSQLVELMTMLQNGLINLHLARLILQEMIAHPKKSPTVIATEKNWRQISQVDELTVICQKVIDGNPKAVESYKKGKKKVLFAFVGEVAKVTEQKANMATVTEIIQKLLN